MSKYIAPKANTYILVEFQSKYGSEESCHSTVVGGRRLPLYRCPLCRHQTSSIVGTIMTNIKLPLAKYISVTLSTVWSLLHKIRSAMGECEALYRLGVFVEMDEAFLDG